MSTALRSIEHLIFRSRGALYEADIFSVLSHSPYVIRGFEFSLADGAVDCDEEYSMRQDFANRLWHLQEREPPRARRLVLFDVKSSVAERAGEQEYICTERQQQTVAFFIGVCAADPTYVDVIPNFSQDEAALARAQDDAQDFRRGEDERPRDVIANVTRVCKLPTGAYGGIDQCMSPYRMPLDLLPDAIRRIRACARSQETYVNPWTGVSFPDWTPITTSAKSLLHPALDTAHFTAYRVVMDVLTAVTNVAESQCRLQLVGLQPRLADFKINGALVQQKVDETVRAKGSLLTSVPAARGDRHYFNAFDRFDFIWYQFTFSRTSGGASHYVFYLLPERELPDDFFTTTDTHVSFERGNFEPYRVEMDREALWICDVERILTANPHPRRAGERPLRPILVNPPPPPQSSDARAASVFEAPAPGKAKGRGEYSEMLQLGQRRFFYMTMKQCAIRMSGLLLVLATNHPMADFAFCRYRWTERERDDFLLSLRVPACAHHLPSYVDVVPICFYTQYAECGYQGPMVRPRQFRRLESCSGARLLAWDLEGYDAKDEEAVPIVIPTKDLTATDAQRALFRRALTIRANTPQLSALLRTGLYPIEYAVGHLGPCVLGESNWARLWSLFDQFTQLCSLQHPRGIARDPFDYRYTLQSLHQRLAREQKYTATYIDEFAEDD